MDVFEAIGKRHSYRGAFEKKPVPREHLVKIVQAGIQAPSGCNGQTTSFVIVDDPAKIAAVGAAVDRPVVKVAPAIILCVVEHRPVYRGVSFGAEDCAAAVENMLLAITAMGYASVWIDGVLRVDGVARKVASLVGVPDDREVRILLPIGVPSEKVEQKEKLAFDRRAWFNNYDG